MPRKSRKPRKVAKPGVLRAPQRLPLAQLVEERKSPNGRDHNRPGRMHNRSQRPPLFPGRTGGR